jgi:hypothetical protein
LGDYLRVAVAHVDVDRRELDFRLVSRLKSRPAGPATKAARRKSSQAKAPKKGQAARKKSSTRQDKKKTVSATGRKKTKRNSNKKGRQRKRQ